MAQSTAKRRRRQAQNGYKHIAPLQRPHYTKTSQAQSDKANERYRQNKMKGLVK